MAIFNPDQAQKYASGRILELRDQLEQDRILAAAIHKRLGIGTEAMAVATQIALGNVFKQACLKLRDEGLAAFVRDECRILRDRASGPTFLFPLFCEMAELRG